MSNPNVPEWTNTTSDASKDVEFNAPASNPTIMSSVELDTIDTTPAGAVASTAPSERTGGRCLKWMNSGISLFFFAIFVASAIFKTNDAGGVSVLWTLFYSLQAIVAGACLVLQCCLKLPCVRKPVLGLAVSMLVWSIIMVIITSINLADAPGGGPSEGGDNNDWTNREEKAYELAGAALGLASALYHVLVWKYCGMFGAK